jgi:DNA-binding response OmpR family regulator
VIRPPRLVKEMTMEKRRPLVLVADDDNDILELVRLRLIRSGYDPLVATDGAEALMLARAYLPDIVVLDVGMPDLDGYAVTAELRAGDETAGIPIILLTARAQEADVDAGIGAGADDYITKPFSPEFLATRISAVLEAAAAERRASTGEPLLRQAPLL